MFDHRVFIDFKQLRFYWTLSFDTAYFVMKKIPYDVIKNRKSSQKGFFKVIWILFWHNPPRISFVEKKIIIAYTAGYSTAWHMSALFSTEYECFYNYK